jgi:hypothetical protein
MHTFAALAGKVKSSLCLIKQYSMKICVEVDVLFHVFLTMTLNGGELSASCLGHFTHGGWIGPRTGLGRVMKKICASARN